MKVVPLSILPFGYTVYSHRVAYYCIKSISLALIVLTNSTTYFLQTHLILDRYLKCIPNLLRQGHNCLYHNLLLSCFNQWCSRARPFCGSPPNTKIKVHSLQNITSTFNLKLLSRIVKFCNSFKVIFVPNFCIFSGFPVFDLDFSFIS